MRRWRQANGIFRARILLAGLLYWQAGLGSDALAQAAEQSLPQLAPRDTLTAAVILLPGQQPPVTVAVVPDSVVFGGMAYALLNWRPGATLPAASEVSFSVDWLALADPKDSLPKRVDWLPAATDSSLVIPFRVYQTAPFRILAGAQASDVIVALGRTGGSGDLAPIRQPRIWGGGWMPLVLAVLALLLLALVAWLLVRRSRRGHSDPWADWEVMSPAWIGAAVELQLLLDGDALARGDGRRFLDGLAAVARRFVRDHYHIPAPEMTGREIVSACVGLGYAPGLPRQFAQIIDLADRCRYDRGQPGTAFCLGQAGLLAQLMRTVKITPRQTVVPPQMLLQAEQAWAAIVSKLGSSDRGGLAENPAGGV